MVYEHVLQRYLESAKDDLESVLLESPLSPPLVRSLLLERQKATLERVVMEYNSQHKEESTSFSVTTDDVQGALRNIKEDDNNKSLLEASRDLDETARLTYARLVLYSSCRRETEQQSLRDQIMTLKASGSMERKDLIDFFALCQTCVRLPFVMNHIAKGEPLFEDIVDQNNRSSTDKDVDSVTTLPQHRLEHLQRLLLKEFGYDPHFGVEEVKRIFFSKESNEFTGDAELFDMCHKTTEKMQAVLSNANIQASMSSFSDLDKGGVTRVVAVDYSEKMVDASGNVIDEGPRREIMAEQTEEDQRQQLHVASKAAALQKEILGELLAMSKSDRNIKLAEAERVSNAFLRLVAEKPPGPQRIQVLRSIDEPTQRLLAMHKLWQGYVASNGGTEPDIKKFQGESE